MPPSQDRGWEQQLSQESSSICCGCQRDMCPTCDDLRGTMGSITSAEGGERWPSECVSAKDTPSERAVFF